MTISNHAFVRHTIEEAKPAPSSAVGISHWLRTKLFATPKDTVLTVLAIAFLAYLLPPIFKWLFVDAVWTGTDRIACLTASQGGALADGQSGACWAFVSAKFGQIMFGRYPIDERWRPILVMVMFTILLVPMLIPKAPFKRLNALALFIILPVIAFFLLIGGVFGLPVVGNAALGRPGWSP